MDDAFVIPDSPAALLDEQGRILPCAKLLLIGLGRDAELPCTLRERLDRDAVPYRIVGVSAGPEFVALFGSEGVIQGPAEIIAWLDRRETDR